MIDWIPVSERLPEGVGQFLVSIHNRMFNIYGVEILWYGNHNGFYLYDREHGDVPRSGVTAWAMLPEPYKGDKQ